MPRTRSLAWAELKIGLVADLRPRHGDAAHLPAERRGRLLLAALLAQDRVRQRRRPEGGRAGARGRRRGRLGHRASTSSATASRSSMEVSKEHAAADHDRRRSPSLGSVSLLGEAAVDITAVEPGHADSGVGLRAVAAAPPASLADVADAGDARASSRPTALLQDIRAGKGTIGQAVHRRRALSAS